MLYNTPFKLTEKETSIIWVVYDVKKQTAKYINFKKIIQTYYFLPNARVILNRIQVLSYVLLKQFMEDKIKILKKSYYWYDLIQNLIGQTFIYLNNEQYQFYKSFAIPTLLKSVINLVTHRDAVYLSGKKVFKSLRFTQAIFFICEAPLK